jgi:hypothetical protein
MANLPTAYRPPLAVRHDDDDRPAAQENRPPLVICRRANYPRHDHYPVAYGHDSDLPAGPYHADEPAVRYERHHDGPAGQQPVINIHIDTSASSSSSANSNSAEQSSFANALLFGLAVGAIAFVMTLAATHTVPTWSYGGYYPTGGYSSGGRL